MADAPMTIPQKTQIGDWTINDLLGAGGQGSVYSAKPTTTKNSPKRALKVSFATEPAAQERFRREYETLKANASPNIAAVFDADLEWKARLPTLPPFAYFVLELFDCSLDKAPLGNASNRLRIFREACAAVQFLHQRGVLHRDIKPENLFLKSIVKVPNDRGSEFQSVVLADFGLVKDGGGRGRDVTKTHEVVGTPVYRAPEVSNGADPTIQSEVYSLGRLLEWLLTGEVSKTMDLRPVPRGAEFSDDACNVLDQIVMKACQASPSNRYPSVAELLAAVPDLWLAAKPKAPVDLAATQSPISEALDLARRLDIVGWQTARGRLRVQTRERLFAWRAALEGTDASHSAKPAESLVDAAWPLISFSLAGVYSRNRQFSSVTAIVDDLLPTDWRRSGRTDHVEAPRTLLYLFHYLHGALCLDSNVTEIDAALDVAEAPVIESNTNSLRPLFEHHDLVGAPRLWGYNQADPWKPFRELLDRKPELLGLFPSAQDLERGLDAYSALLSLVEFASDAANPSPVDLTADIILRIHPWFLRGSEADVQQAARRTSGNKAVVAAICARTGASSKVLKERWPAWTEHLQKFRSKIRQDWWNASVVTFGPLAG